MGTLHEYVRTLMIMYRSDFLRMRYVSDNKCFPESRAFYEIMWKNNGRTGQIKDDTIRHVRFGCWLSTATDTH